MEEDEQTTQQRFVVPALRVEEQPAVMVLTENLKYIELEGMDP